MLTRAINYQKKNPLGKEFLFDIIKLFNIIFICVNTIETKSMYNKILTFSLMGILFIKNIWRFPMVALLSILFYFSVYASELDPLSKLKEWIGVEKTYSQEREEWRAKKVWLEEQITLGETELKSLREKSKDIEAIFDDSEKETESLLATQKELELQVQKLEAILSKVEKVILGLRIQFPEPLQKELEIAFLKITNREKPTDGRLSERFQNALAILALVQNFDQKVTIAETLRTTDQGETYLVDTIYFGLGQAYYTGAKDAGVGVPSDRGWQWKSFPKLKEPIRKTIAIAQGQRGDISFVNLPISLQNNTGNYE